MNFWHRIVDRWVTHRTGLSRETRELFLWQNHTIAYAASTLENKYHNFKYIIKVDPDKFFNWAVPNSWEPVNDFRQYEFPNRKLGDNAVFSWERGDRDQWDGRFHLNDFGSGDYVFVATNNTEDAVMISLKYS